MNAIDDQHVNVSLLGLELEPQFTCYCWQKVLVVIPAQEESIFALQTRLIQYRTPEFGIQRQQLGQAVRV